MKDINKILANGKTQHIFVETCLHEAVEVSLSCLHFSLMFSEGEVKSPYFLQVWWALQDIYETCLKWTLNKLESCINQTLSHNEGNLC